MSRELKGEIVVASRIVDYLSSGLYESPAACLKELVNNAYDADAKKVELFVKPDANRIIVTDDGHGMDSKDFEKNFSKISESFKREDSELTKSSRPKIGKIGIGFIAANEICDVMQIISTKAGSTEKINIEINFKAMRSPIDERRRGESNFAKADYIGKTESAPAGEHYTHIFLKEIRGPAQELLAGARDTGEETSLYGLSPEAIAKRLRDPMLRSWEGFDFYSRTMLEVALNVPIKYAKNWCTTRYTTKLKSFTSAVEDLDFCVTFDGTELEKPIIFSDTDRSLIKTFKFSGKDVAFKSYFYVQHGIIKPQDLNGVLIRIRNSAVGKYERGFLGFPNSIGTLFQRWISAELWADDRLEPAMNIDRRTLRVTHPAYLEMIDELHKQLREVLNETREVLYETPAKDQREVKANEELTAIRKSVSNVKQLSVAENEKFKSTRNFNQKSLLRKYSTAELFDLVLEVAERTLKGPVLKDFVTELMKTVFKK